MHVLIMRRKFGSSGCLTRIEESPSGYQNRVYWSQEGAGSGTKGRIQIFLVSVFCAVFFTLKNIREKPWYVPSKKLVIQETVFYVSDLTTLPYLKDGVTKLVKMSVVELKNLSNDDLKKCLAQQIDINNKRLD